MPSHPFDAAKTPVVPVHGIAGCSSPGATSQWQGSIRRSTIPARQPPPQPKVDDPEDSERERQDVLPAFICQHSQRNPGTKKAAAPATATAPEVDCFIRSGLRTPIGHRLPDLHRLYQPLSEGCDASAKDLWHGSGANRVGPRAMSSRSSRGHYAQEGVGIGVRLMRLIASAAIHRMRFRGNAFRVSAAVTSLESAAGSPSHASLRA